MIVQLKLYFAGQTLMPEFHYSLKMQWNYDQVTAITHVIALIAHILSDTLLILL